MLTQTSLRSCSQWFCFRALKLDAYYTNAFVARAQVYQKKNEYDRALRKYDEVIGIQPTWGAFMEWTLPGESPARPVGGGAL